MINSRAVLNYVDAPILLRFHANDGFNCFAGPQGSILLGSFFEADDVHSNCGWETVTIYDLDAELVFGLGYNLPVSA